MECWSMRADNVVEMDGLTSSDLTRQLSRRLTRRLARLIMKNGMSVRGPVLNPGY